MQNHPALFWSARILGLVLALFLSLFALDAFAPGRPAGESIAGFAIHLLPAFLVLAIVAVSWNRPWIAGIAFLILGAAYAASVNFRPDWMLVISGPLFVTGLLFLWSWVAGRAAHVS